MKLHTKDNPVERGGIAAGSENTFKIRTTAKAFSILSSGIYSDPIMAVIRELSCNAYDAHVDAGKKDEPFELHLPNALEPWLSIKDNGIGLSDDQVRNLYTTYFESTKTESNDVIGALGLGSKSPFSYTQAFEVIARHDGVRRTYSVFLNEQDIPTITRMGEIATDECNGIEVKITVKSEDHTRFEKKAAEVLKYFPVKPIVHGKSHFEFDELPDDRFDGDGYFAVPRGYYDEDRFTAVQGHVPYRVEIGKVREVLNSNENEFLDHYRVVAFFDIGDLDVAASREEIRYDERSLENLANKIRKARYDFIKRTDDELVTLTKNADNRWDAYQMLNKKFGELRHVRAIADGYKWTANIVNEWIESEGKIEALTPEFHTLVAYKHGKLRAVKAHDYTKNIVPHEVTIKPSMYHDVVVIADVRVRSSLRLNRYLDTMLEDRWTTALVISEVNEKAIKARDPKIRKIAYKKDLKDLLKALGNPETVLLSEVTEDVRLERSGPRAKGLTYSKFCPAWTPSRGHVGDRVPQFMIVDAPESGQTNLYVEVTTAPNKKFVGLDGQTKPWSHGTARVKVARMLQVINAVKGTEYKGDNLFGLTKKVVKAVKDDAEWVNVFDLFAEAAEEVVDLYKYYADKSATESSYGLKSLVFGGNFEKYVEDLCDDSEFVTTLLPVAQKDVEMKKRLGGISEDHIHAVRELGIEFGVDAYKDVEEGKPLFDPSTLMLTYPMLKHVNSLNAKDDIVHYINMVDGC